jgi:hypothetical protein
MLLTGVQKWNQPFGSKSRRLIADGSSTAGLLLLTDLIDVGS